MPPILALFLTIGFIVYILRKDQKNIDESGAVWLPTIWFLTISSRHLSLWLQEFGIQLGATSLEDGSPLDRLLFLFLIVSGIIVLTRRGVQLSLIFENNKWLTLFLLYCFLSILWSDFQFVAFKRYIKVLGHPIMVLVLLTEKEPEKALFNTIRRTAVILVPLSVTLVKYFPYLSRRYDEWTGLAMTTGVTTDKNILGWTCMIFGFYFFTNLLVSLKLPKSQERRNNVIIALIYLGMIGWLLYKANSKTSQVSLVAGILFVLLLGRPWLSKRYLGLSLSLIVIPAILAEWLFKVSDKIIIALGRDPSLTDRTEVWADVLAIPNNPLIGKGFESFWLGERLDILWSIWKWRPNQAHNGYIEIYINLGILGFILWLAITISTYFKAKGQFDKSFEFARFRIAFIGMILLFSWTESPFKATHAVFFMYYLIVLEYPSFTLRKRI